MNALSKIIWIISTILLIVAIFYAHSLFDQTVALHFNEDDIADSYVTRDAYFYTVVGVAFAASFIFLGIAAFIHRIPVQLLQIPQKSFWVLDKDHQYKAKQIIARTLWFGAAAANILILIGHLMIFDQNANFFESTIPYVWMVIAGVVFFFVCLMSGLIRLAYPKLDIVELQTYSGSR